MNSKMPNIKQILTLVAVASAGVFLYLPASALMESNASDSQPSVGKELAQTTPPLPTVPTPSPTPLTLPGDSLTTPLPTPEPLPTTESAPPQGGGTLAPDASPSPMESPAPLPSPTESPTLESAPSPQGGMSTPVEPAPTTEAPTTGTETTPAASNLEKGTWLCLNNPNAACR